MEPLSVTKKGSRLVLCLQLPPMYALTTREYETLKKLEHFEFEQDFRTIVLDLSRVKRIGTRVIESLLKFLTRCIERPSRRTSDIIYIVGANSSTESFLAACGVLESIRLVDKLSAT